MQCLTKISAGSIGPHRNSAQAMALTTTGSSGSAASKKPSLQRSALQHADQKTRDHLGSSESRRKDGLLISCAWCSHTSKSTSRAATDSWSALRARNLAAARDSCRSDSLRIALRSASDFETFQRRANPSSAWTVPASSEYVHFIVMTAILPIIGPPAAERRIA